MYSSHGRPGQRAGTCTYPCTINLRLTHKTNDKSTLTQAWPFAAEQGYMPQCHKSTYLAEESHPVGRVSSPPRCGPGPVYKTKPQDTSTARVDHSCMTTIRAQGIGMHLDVEACGASKHPLLMTRAFFKSPRAALRPCASLVPPGVSSARREQARYTLHHRALHWHCHLA